MHLKKVIQEKLISYIHRGPLCSVGIRFCGITDFYRREIVNLREEK
jgi:hypothetical protein